MRFLSVPVLVSCIMAWTGVEVRKAEHGMIEEKVMELMRKLDSLDEGDRMQLLSRVDEQRNELLGVLLKHLGTSASENVQAAAIYLIGRHRLAGGVGALIRRVEFAPDADGIREPEPLWDRYPAMEALINIGRPSVSAAVELLANDPDDTRRDLAIKVIRYVEDAEIDKLILKRAHLAEADKYRKRRLEDAVSRFEKLVQETK